MHADLSLLRQRIINHPSMQPGVAHIYGQSGGLEGSSGFLNPRLGLYATYIALRTAFHDPDILRWMVTREVRQANGTYEVHGRISIDINPQLGVIGRGFEQPSFNRANIRNWIYGDMLRIRVVIDYDENGRFQIMTAHPVF